ncbi:MAG: hypothetical protein NT113_01740 [Hyphomicrobiales bacterium]|nr:hypothetical protein [Hyphomicrobiales bacterium]
MPAHHGKRRQDVQASHTSEEGQSQGARQTRWPALSQSGGQYERRQIGQEEVDQEGDQENGKEDNQEDGEQTSQEDQQDNDQENDQQNRFEEVRAQDREESVQEESFQKEGRQESSRTESRERPQGRSHSQGARGVCKARRGASQARRDQEDIREAHAWGEPVPKTVAAARKIAAKGERLLDRYHKLKKDA